MSNNIKTIPKEWKEICINDLCENLDSKRGPISKENRISGQIAYYGATGVVDYVDGFLFDEELVLVGEDGADWSKFANTAYLINGKSWVNNHAHVLRCTKINPIFLINVLNWNDLRDYAGGSTRGKLNKGDLMKIEIAVPPTYEQNKIVDILSSVDDEIEKVEQVIKKTEELKNGLMIELFTKGIGHTKFKKTKLGEIPGDWQIEKLSNLLTIVIDHRGITPKKLGGDWSDSGVPTISAMNIKRGEIVNCDKIRFVSADLYNKWMPESLFEGDVLLTSEAPLGELYVVKKNEQYCLSQRLFCLRVNKSKLHDYYCYYFLMSQFGQNSLQERSSGSTAKGIRQKELVKIEFILPPVDEQISIAKILSSVDYRLNINKKIKIALTELKNGLMQDLLSGRVRTEDVLRKDLFDAWLAQFNLDVGQCQNIKELINSVFVITKQSRDEIVSNLDFSKNENRRERLEAALSELRAIIFLRNFEFKNIKLLKADKKNRKSDINAVYGTDIFEIEVACLTAVHSREKNSYLNCYEIDDNKLIKSLKTIAENKKTQFNKSDKKLLVYVINKHPELELHDYKDYFNILKKLSDELKWGSDYYFAIMTGSEINGKVCDIVYPELKK